MGPRLAQDDIRDSGCGDDCNVHSSVRRDQSQRRELCPRLGTRRGQGDWPNRIDLFLSLDVQSLERLRLASQG